MSLVPSLRAVVALLATSAGVMLASTELRAERRVALVIGNSEYRNVAALGNPVNDARAMADKLKAMKGEYKFDVILALNSDRAAMLAKLNEFRAKTKGADVALVFYAGHGIAINSESFFLPVDTPSQISVTGEAASADAMAGHLVSMATLLAPLNEARVGIAFLDACRNTPGRADLGLKVVALDPKGGATRAVPVSRGLASMTVVPTQKSLGMFRAYATAADNVAVDGAGRNSPFTSAILRHIDKSGLEIRDLMLNVRTEVMKETSGKQVPWEEAALNARFYFLPPATGSGPIAGPSIRPNTEKSETGSVSAAGRVAKPRADEGPRTGGNGVNTYRPPGLGVGVGMGM